MRSTAFIPMNKIGRYGCLIHLETFSWRKARKKKHSHLDIVECVLYSTHMNTEFGQYLRQKREALRAGDRRYSLRQVAGRIGVEPSHLSKIERGEMAYLSEEKLVALARELDEDPDVLLALSGKVSQDLQQIIRKRPQLFAQLIRQLKNAPDQAVLRIVREVRDGDW